MEEKLLAYHNDGDWKGVLQMYNGIGENKFNNKLFLWIQPSEDDLKFIEQQLSADNLTYIFSIGCGTGLLEWLIQSSTGIQVRGIEIDRKWWESQYAPPRFIPLAYADEAKQLQYPINSALMFCYFNNKTAFWEYLNNYDGKCLIIIGPGPRTERHSEPSPFTPELQEMGWTLSSSREIQNTQDYIAIYRLDQEYN